MNLGDFIGRTAHFYGRRTAVVDGDRTLSFAEVDERANRLANALLADGMVPGDRVAVLVGNRLEWFDATFGLAKAGLIRTYVNPRSSPAEVAYQLSDAGVSAVVLAGEYRQLLGDADSDAVRVIEIGEGYEKWLAASEPHRPDVPAAEDDVLAIQYSSGTTGRPKGIIHTHGNYLAFIRGMVAELEFDEDKVFLHAAQMSHVGGAFSYMCLARGSMQVLHRGFDPRTLIDALSRHRVTTTMLVPTMLYALLDAVADGAEIDPSTLDTVIYVSAPMAPDRIERCLEVLGPVLVQTYGSSEALGGVTFLSKRDHAEGGSLLASAGRAALIGELRVVDEEGVEVAQGQVGEVVVRGDHVTPGYWNRPDAMSDSFDDDGWLHTNDLARVDERGYLYLLDRKKDLIISGGFNVYPVEVENALLAHPDVAEAAVFGVPDTRWGEAIRAVVRAAPATREDDLRRWCRERLASYKVPKAIDVVTDELPKNSSGKVLRRALREPFWQGHQRRVG
jgi:long-chain acyl-CoA synthetase